MVRLFIRATGFILILCVCLISLMQVIGRLREQGTILVAFDNDGIQPYTQFVFTDTGAILKVPRNGFPTLSPNSCYYSSVSANSNQAEITIVDIAKGQNHQFNILDYSNTWLTIWSPDSRYMALVNFNLSSGAILLSVIEVDSGAIWQLDPNPVLVNSILEWSPTTKFIALTGYTEEDGQTGFIYDFRENQLTAIEGQGLETSSRFMWSPDEHYILVMMGNTPEKLGIIDRQSASFYPIQALHAIRGQASWSPDGDLYIAGQDATSQAEMLYRVDAKTGTYEAIESIPYGTLLGNWSETGQYMLYFDTQERLVNIFDPKQGHIMAMPQKAGGDMISYWSSDNQLFSTRLRGGQLWIVDATNNEFYETGQKITQLFDWLNHEQFVYVSDEKEIHLAQFRNRQFEILARYPLRQLNGICVPEN